MRAAPRTDPSEVFHRYDLVAETLPSYEETEDEGWEVCLTVFETLVGSPYEDSKLDVWISWPSEDSWNMGDRAVTCVVYTRDGSKLEASAAGTGS